MNDSVGIITAADSAYHKWAMLMIASARQCVPDIPAMVVDLGLDRFQCKELDRLNILHAEFDWRKAGEMLHLPERDTKLWCKPFMFAMSPFRQTLWLDADCLVLRDLGVLLDALEDGSVFVPDVVSNWDNDDQLYRLMPVMGRCHGRTINSGVVGLDLLRDRELMDLWTSIVKLACDNNNLRRMVRLHDQGSLLWAVCRLGLLDRMQDRRFNISPRMHGDQVLGVHRLDELRRVFPHVSIMHFMGGHKKHIRILPSPGSCEYLARLEEVTMACQKCPYFSGMSDNHPCCCKLSGESVVQARVKAAMAQNGKLSEDNRRIFSIDLACPDGRFVEWGIKV